MESSYGSSELSPSDLEVAVSTIRSRSGLVGYRNLLSYTSALGIKVFSEASVNTSSWTRLGSGAYSTTWKAETDGQQGGGGAVAIKQPNASFTRESAELEDDLQHEALTRIIQELRILAHPKLRAHPNLPHILGVFFREEESPPGIRPCVIFDLAVSDLKKYLVARQPQDIPARDMVRLCSNVADGICGLHACSLVHGDIKPENVLLFMREGVLTAAVGDLDTCAIPTRNQGGTINGTVRYAPPEYQSRSPYREHVNRPSRDVYNYGLLVWSISTGCARDPFPPDLRLQYDLQHDDEATMRCLLNALPGGRAVPSLYQLINLCVRSDPELRPTMFEIARLLDPTSANRQLQELEQALEADMFTDPNAPRVKSLSQLSLPAHLISKLGFEYCNASSQDNASQNAITLAALYSGVVGPSINQPWSSLAKAQWLLKAVELGSYAAVASIMRDENVLRLIENFNSRLLRVRHYCFQSPDVDLDAVLLRLRGFATIPDIDSFNIFAFLGGDITLILDGEDSLNAAQLEARLEQRHRIRADAPHLFELERFTVNRDADLEIVDSDAYDLSFAGASKLERSIYYNNLEDFVTLAEEQGIQAGDDTVQNCMLSAVFHGSLDVVRYLVHHYRVSPNDSWKGMTHINSSILFQRQLVVEFFLESDAELLPAHDDRASGLHLVSRHDNPALVRLLCERLKSRDRLATVLESRPTEGSLAGWSVAYTAMACRAFANLSILLEYGAKPDTGCAEDRKRLIDLAVAPMSPAAPISILLLLLQKGARAHPPGKADAHNTTLPEEYANSPLMWAVRSTNALAVFHLVMHDVPIPDDAIPDAEENEVEMREDKVVPVFDEEGLECPDGWRNAAEATGLVATILRIGRQKQHGGWKQRLEAVVREASEGCKGKMWVANKVPVEYLIEVRCA